MKLTFFGTAAAEGCPALFCSCECCQTARARGGKDLRGRTQSLVNNDLLIDFGPETLSHFQRFGVRGDLLETVLITHSHYDHLYRLDFRLHGSFNAYAMERERLTVLCPEGVYRDLQAYFRGEVDPVVADTLDVRAIKPFECVEIGQYRITALPARHAPGEVALFYIIQQGEKTLLYAHDTGYFYDEVLDFIRERGFIFDCASFDCTYARRPSPAGANHMGLNAVAQLIDTLRGFGAIRKDTQLFVNHFSHTGSPLHEEMETLAAPIGCGVAWDGCTVDF